MASWMTPKLLRRKVRRVDGDDRDRCAGAYAGTRFGERVIDDSFLVICNAGVLRTATVFSDDVYEALRFELEGNLSGFIRLVRAFAGWDLLGGHR